MPVFAGDVVGGKYRIEHLLGEGGMGVVVAARHLELQELYAIKIMKREVLGEDAYAERRFLGEARAAARLKGEHVARVHDIGRLDTGELYMVMEHLRGTDLKQVVRDSGALPVHEAITYLLQTCEAIAEAHTLNIIHRDIKPHNLFLTDGRRSIKVLDFGISKQPAAVGPDLTGSNVMLGTLSYMSPEQMNQSNRVDARSDIWSMGVVLYELVTAAIPFPGPGIFEIVSQVYRGPPLPPSCLRPELPAAVDAIVARCLQIDPELRFASADDLASALRSIVAPSLKASTTQTWTQSTGSVPPIVGQLMTDMEITADLTAPTAPEIEARTTTPHRRNALHPRAPEHVRTDAPKASDADTDPAVDTERRSSRSRWVWVASAGALGILLLAVLTHGEQLPRLEAASRPLSGLDSPPPGSTNGPRPDTSVTPRLPGRTEPAPPSAPAEQERRSPEAADAGQPGREAAPPTHDDQPKAPPSTRRPRKSNPGTAKKAPPDHNDIPLSDTPAHKLMLGDAYCKDFGAPFLFRVDVKEHSKEKRIQLIVSHTCDGDYSETALCCIRKQVD